MTPARWTLLVLVLILLSALSLFTVQNVERTTDLSFDLWFWAGHLQRPLPVPALLLGCFGAGLLVGGGWGLLGRMSAQRRVSGLEQDMARMSLRGPGAGAGSAPSDDPWG